MSKPDWKVTKLIDTACGECIVRVEAIKPTTHDPEGWVYVSLISEADLRWRLMWKNRLKNAWKAFKGEGWMGFELFDEDDVKAILAAIDEAGREAFPKLVIDTELRRGKS